MSEAPAHVTCASAIDAPHTMAAPRRGVVSACLELGKIRLSGLVVVTAAVGFILASGPSIDTPALLWTMLGTLLAAVGANAWNQWLEADRDARMRRTARRPLPARELTPAAALVFAVVTGLGGPALLLWQVNEAAAFLALVTLVIYVFLYTPMKVVTPLNTLVGAITGALPPLLGWAAAADWLGRGAWLLGAILFVWQIPHFLALAWMYRQDYARGGYRMLPATDPTGVRTAGVALLYTGVLLPLTLAPALPSVALAGVFYAGGALVLGAGLAALAWRFYRTHADADARRLFLGSVLYLPLLMALLVADRIPTGLILYPQ